MDGGAGRKGSRYGLCAELLLCSYQAATQSISCERLEKEPRHVFVVKYSAILLNSVFPPLYLRQTRFTSYPSFLPN